MVLVGIGTGLIFLGPTRDQLAQYNIRTDDKITDVDAISKKMSVYLLQPTSYEAMFKTLQACHSVSFQMPQTTHGRPAWKISMGRFYVSPNSHSWLIPPRAINPTSTVPWSAIFTNMSNFPNASDYQASEPSRELYNAFLERLGGSYHPDRIKGMSVGAYEKTTWTGFTMLDGRFGAMMNVTLTNEVHPTSSRISHVSRWNRVSLIRGQ